MKTILFCLLATLFFGCGSPSDVDILADEQDFLRKTKGIVREDTVSCEYSPGREAVVCRGLSNTGVLVIASYKHSSDGKTTMHYVPE